MEVFEQLNNTDTFDIKALKPRYCIAGIDLSSTTDLTCASIIFKVPNNEMLYVKQMYWLPADLLEKRTQYDNSELSIDPFEPGSIWHKDLEALDFAIAVIKKAYQLDTE